jgi:hypothetical protein
MWKRLRCRIGGHDWRKDSTEDGSRFLTCRRCGKYSDLAERGHWATGGF